VKSGYFKIMNRTQRIPVVALTLDPRIKQYNEFDVSFKVRERGWVLSAYTMPPNAETITSLRIVVRPHLNRNVVDQLAEDIVSACEYLDKHGGTATPPTLHARQKTSVKC
jgi:glutamate decarboxylase